MKQSNDPFEAAYEEEEEEEETPPDSPAAADELDASQVAPAAASQDHAASVVAALVPEDDETGSSGVVGAVNSTDPSTPANAAAAGTTPISLGSRNKASNNNKEDYDEEEEYNMDVELSKFPSNSDPDKMVKMQAILSQFTEDQMSRYESFRRSALQKANMRRLLVSITGTQKISLPMTIVVCGIAKMFVGELVETARIVMTERKESGPIRPCHIREAYRRLKLEGKIPKRSVPRLFR